MSERIAKTKRSPWAVVRAMLSMKSQLAVRALAPENFSKTKNSIDSVGLAEIYRRLNENKKISVRLGNRATNAIMTGHCVGAVSSIGRAFGLHPKGHRFEPCTAHSLNN
jgi:hypothetical protein